VLLTIVINEEQLQWWASNELVKQIDVICQ